MKSEDYHLIPSNDIIFLTSSGVSTLSHDQVSSDLVGGKAFGLACLPRAWTPPFFVISSQFISNLLATDLHDRITYLNANFEHFRNASNLSGLAPLDKIIVRSSGQFEGMNERGSYYSVSGDMRSLASLIYNCIRIFEKDEHLSGKKLCLVVQKYIDVHVCKGHLSNERRFYKEGRDWIVEFDPPTKSKSINLRNWREQHDVSQFVSRPLECALQHNLLNVLTAPASWAYDLFGARLHYEWVWDGGVVFLVQADEANENEGIDPRTLKSDFKDVVLTFKPKILIEFNSGSPTSYNKLNNVHTYSKLGLPTARFFILNDYEILKELADEYVRPELKDDIDILVKNSLVIRTDTKSKDLNNT